MFIYKLLEQGATIGFFSPSPAAKTLVKRLRGRPEIIVKRVNSKKSHKILKQRTSEIKQARNHSVEVYVVCLSEEVKRIRNQGRGAGHANVSLMPWASFGI